MALQKRDVYEELSKTFTASIKYTLFVPATINVARSIGSRVIALESRELSDVRQQVIDEIVATVSNTAIGGVTIMGDHNGTWYDSDLKLVVRERGTQIVAIVPIELHEIEVFDLVLDKRVKLTVPAFFRRLAKGIQETFNQSSVLLTAEPVYMALV